jgi:curved DNA-binding protein CbpA
MPLRQDDDFLDHYEILQISPNAEAETIQRCYRMLAHRYHPDNRETGSEEKFKLVREAYRVLSDPSLRAEYDVDYHNRRTLRWKVFDPQVAAGGAESEKGIRNGILSLLYTKRRAEPYNPGVPLLEIEDLLGLPREHLEFSLWYLKEKKLVLRTDDSQFLITADGVEFVEQIGLPGKLRKMIEHHPDDTPVPARKAGASGG